MIHPLDLMEPEETIGDLWHDIAGKLGAEPEHPEAAVELEEARPAARLLFRALGGGAEVEIAEAPAIASAHRLNRLRRIGAAQETRADAAFDGERLRLPPRIAVFPDRRLNRAAYLWLAAQAAFAEPPESAEDPCAADLAEIEAAGRATEAALEACPGLRATCREMSLHLLAGRRRSGLPAHEAAVEQAILARLAEAAGLAAPAPAAPPARPAPRGYRPFLPVAIWPRLRRSERAAAPAADADEAAPPTLAVPTKKAGERAERDQANRKDGFIIHRFESIMSWAESLNINRMTDDDDQDNAAKAAEDQDHLTLSQHWKRAATRLRIHLDLSPQDAEHERLSDRFTYPEWNPRLAAYMPDHTRVLEAEPEPAEGFAPDPRLMNRVRRQFQALHPRRVSLPRQMDGTDLDLDAVIAARAELAATGRGSDRIYAATRAVERDLAAAILIDCSRSTESAMGERSVIDISREALAALAGGIDAAGDRLAIWGFSSLRRDRVFLNRCKRFDEPMSAVAHGRIGGLRPGHYTRLGAAVRHASAQLAEQGAARRLLLILTDGKPNDLDHYEGVHGIEDSRMAVREARALGQAVHGVVVDADGQDWFARIFGRAGFTLLPDPERLPRALPQIYRSLTVES